MGHGGQLVQGDAVAEVFVQIALGSRAFLVFGGGLGGNAQGHRRHAHQLDQHHFQNILADHLAAVLFVVHLPQQHTDHIKDIFPHVVAFEHGVAKVFLVKEELCPFDAQHHVFQRVGLVAELGVLDPRVDDDQIVRLHVMKGTLDVELPPPADAVEHLAAGVGMRHRVPVPAEPAFADVKQAHRFARRDFHIQIIAGIHRSVLLPAKILQLLQQHP